MPPPPEGLEHAPKAGEIFAGKYTVERVLGVGGMGYVLAATHLQLHKRVAIKMLLPSHAADPSATERFLREARAAVKIQSAHCVRVLDVGELPDRTPFIVLEYLDGHDLDGVLKARGKLPVELAVDYVLQASEAVAEAHSLKIIHRDLKPANLFLQRLGNGDELVKVLDFGISKMSGPAEGSMSMTRTSAMMGSPLYMSPEQLKSSKNVDERADQWALGVILYELIAGVVPFQADTMAELGALVLSGATPWLADVAPDAPPDLCGIVATCMRVRPQDRFANLADFADAIAPFGTPGARKSVDAIVRTLGMPTMRAQRVSLGSVATHARPSDAGMHAASGNQLVVVGGLASTPGPGWGSRTPAPAPSQSSPRAITLMDSGTGALPVQRGQSRAAAVAIAVIALASVGAIGTVAWRSHRAPSATVITSAVASFDPSHPLVPDLGLASPPVSVSVSSGLPMGTTASAPPFTAVAAAPRGPASAAPSTQKSAPKVAGAPPKTQGSAIAPPPPPSAKPDHAMSSKD